MHIAFVANGKIEDYNWLRDQLKSYDKKVAVDGGLMHYDAINVTPDVLYGDFDSVKKNLLEKYYEVPQFRLPTDKDKTDLHIAIEKEYDDQVEKMTLFGAFGYRIDHSLLNVLLLANYRGRLFIETPQEILFVIDKSCHLSCFLGQTLSLLPFGEVKNITTHGLKWEVKNQNMGKAFYGISNICQKKEAIIEVGKGDLLCCLSKKLTP